jgi:hypothetical protein
MHSLSVFTTTSWILVWIHVLMALTPFGGVGVSFYTRCAGGTFGTYVTGEDGPKTSTIQVPFSSTCCRGMIILGSSESIT